MGTKNPGEQAEKLETSGLETRHKKKKTEAMVVSSVSLSQQLSEITHARLEIADGNLKATAPASAELVFKPCEITAQDILDKKAAEVRAMALGQKRETHKAAQDLKILAAIMLGKDKNRELAQVLDTDKSFTSKKIKELEDQGLIKKEVNGREVKYSVDRFNLLRFLQSKVVIKWGMRPEQGSAAPRETASEKESEKNDKEKTET